MTINQALNECIEARTSGQRHGSQQYMEARSVIGRWLSATPVNVVLENLEPDVFQNQVATLGEVINELPAKSSKRMRLECLYELLNTTITKVTANPVYYDKKEAHPADRE